MTGTLGNDDLGEFLLGVAEEELPTPDASVWAVLASDLDGGLE